MNLGKLVLNIVPVLIVAALAFFIWRSNRKQRIGVLLAWLFPGLGHLWLGHKKRGLFFAATLIPLFLAGLILADFLNISPFDRHPIWGLAQLPGGLMTGAAWAATSTLKIARDNPYYLIGCLYSGTACLLNLLAICDVWDLAEDGSGEPAPAEVASEGQA